MGCYIQRIFNGWIKIMSMCLISIQQRHHSSFHHLQVYIKLLNFNDLTHGFNYRMNRKFSEVSVLVLLARFKFHPHPQNMKEEVSATRTDTIITIQLCSINKAASRIYRMESLTQIVMACFFRVIICSFYKICENLCTD